LLVAGTAGCQVDTRIDVETTAKGTGTVQVAVTLDKAATRSVGDVKRELQTADLTAAGWRVSGPYPGAGGSTVIRASHPFASLQQASTLVAEIAGTGPAGSRPFQLHVTRHKSFWSTSTRLDGRADLRCNLGCFGDSGLRRELGATTGVDPGTVASQKRDFTFGVTVTLPGTVKSTNAGAVAGHRLTWRAPLGQDTVLSETTSERNTGHLAGAVILASLAPVAIGAGMATVLWRRSRRRRGRAG